MTKHLAGTFVQKSVTWASLREDDEAFDGDQSTKVDHLGVTKENLDDEVLGEDFYRYLDEQILIEMDSRLVGSCISFI